MCIIIRQLGQALLVFPIKNAEKQAPGKSDKSTYQEQPGRTCKLIQIAVEKKTDHHPQAVSYSIV